MCTLDHVVAGSLDLNSRVIWGRVLLDGISLAGLDFYSSFFGDLSYSSARASAAPLPGDYSEGAVSLCMFHVRRARVGL